MKPGALHAGHIRNRLTRAPMPHDAFAGNIPHIGASFAKPAPVRQNRRTSPPRGVPLMLTAAGIFIVSAAVFFV